MKVLSVAFSLTLVSCICAYASDIAFYVGQWNTDGWYGAEQFDDVATIINETGALFKEVKQFDDDGLGDLAEWAEANMDDGEMDIIWLNGCTPSALYPYPNLEPDGSVAERWLDGGNMIINVGDWFAYVSYECGARCTENGSSGAANILDLSSGIISSAGGTQMEVTETGNKYLPSLDDPMKCDRPVNLAMVQDPWEVAAIFASVGGSDDPTKVSQADPVLLHNTETGGYVAIINQTGGDSGMAGWVDRGKVCAEFIKNWIGGVLDIFSVEPSGKLTAMWGEVKRF
jgi:hypothetical protein